jgi:radical SAM superfamily enzyme YgiQ (UPF0313 family)
MRIAFVFAPYNHKKFSENIETVDEEFGVYPPLGPAYAAAIAEKAGHKVILIDANALKLSKKQVLDKLIKFKPDLMAFMLTTYMFHQTLDWIRYLKNKIKVPVICGNLNLTYYPKETLTHKEIDFGIIGSARKALPSLIEAIEENKDFSNIKGICYKKKGKIFVNMPDSFHDEIDKLPFPARHLLPNEKYYQFISKKKNFTIMLTAKACPFKCPFCPIGRLPYSERKVENVIKEIKECYEKYHIREIDFFTPTFTVNKKFVFEFCDGLRKLKKQGIKIDWSCRSRIDTINEKMLKNMATVGCKRIYYGIESGDSKILKNISKDISLQRIRDTIKLTQKYKIKALGFFMVGNPGDTKESVEKTTRFAKSLRLDYVQVMRTIPKPGTSLDDEYIKKTKRDYWKDFVLGKEKEKTLPNIWCNMKQDEINNYIRKMYIKVYLNPGYIFKTLISIKSFGELERYIRAGLSILVNKKIEFNIY